MTVVEHLEELRYRLFIGILALVAGSIVAWILYPSFLSFLTRPLKRGQEIGGVRVEGLNVSGIVTAFNVRLKVSVFGGIVLSLPITLWQLWRFVTPGLRQKERRYAFAFVGSALALFGFGAYAAFIVLPEAIGFLLAFAKPPLQPLIFIDQYLGFVIFMILAFGISFEYPLLLVFLAGVGILSSRKLSSWRRHAFFLSFVVGAVATPSQDPLSMTLMAVPLYVLYEITLLVIRFAMRK